MTTWTKAPDDPRVVHQGRTAMREHRCSSSYVEGCRKLIRAGERYLVSVELPGGEAGYADSAGHPIQMRLCAPCAVYYRCGHLLGRDQSTRAIIDAQIAKWAEDYSFTSPADMAESLLKALDGGR